MMNVNAIGRLCGHLTPAESFRLIVAAFCRGDGTEQDRLVRAAGRLTFSVSDHAPLASAFIEVHLGTFLELLDTAALYTDAIQLADDAAIAYAAEGADNGPEHTEAGSAGDTSEAEAGSEPRAGTGRFRDLTLACGYILKAQADGWNCFCERRGLPSFAIWRGLPGYDRLQRALQLAEKASFDREGMLRWLERTRPEGEPAAAAVPITAESAATGLEGFYQRQVASWSGGH
jgi:hypothetical protein